MQSLKRLRFASWLGLLASTLAACEGEDHRVGSASPDSDNGGSTAARGGTTPGGTGNNGSGGTVAGSGVPAGNGGTIAGSGVTSGNGGAGGTIAGSGPAGGVTGLPECVNAKAPVATGCVRDELDSIKLDLPNDHAIATVTALDRGDPVPNVCQLDPSTAREVVLRTADDRELRYFVALPGLPDDFVTLGDEVDLFVSDDSSIFVPMVQTVVLEQRGELVVFTVNTQFYKPTPDLSAYGLSVRAGEPYCATPSSCGLNTVVQSSDLIVTQGADTQHLKAGDTRQMGGVSISVQEVRDTVGSSSCDPPPGAHRYGGFATGG